MGFEPPKIAESLVAIGETDGLSMTLQRALMPDTDFEPVPVPTGGDWLAEHREPGQTFDEFAGSRRNRPDAVRNIIYLQPLGRFAVNRSPAPELLKAFATAYFMMEVKILPPETISGSNLETRINPFSGNRQILTTDILRLLKRGLPRDAFCVLAITMEDLYPDPSWNFVFGQASFKERVGVFSFARYDPAFYGEKRANGYREVLLRRSCKVLVHETGHMFGLKHCIYFKCVLNGSNHLKESDSRPMHICPVCLHKLQHSIEFKIISRYSKLFHFYQKIGFDDEAQWVANRLKWTLGDEAAHVIKHQEK